MNDILNAVLAILDGRISIAREILRSPSSNIRNLSEIMVKLYQAIDNYVASHLVEIEKKCLRICPDDLSPEEKEQFYAGVASVEAILTEEINRLRS